ncbi:MAG TPA: SPW repeat protein, partial [Vicinamibacterales bacterium]|nr:SPW repeat protein [Vicinamibacterales bacterium]
MKFIRQAAIADILLGLWLLAAPSVIGYQATRAVAVFEDLLPGAFLLVTAALVLFMKSGAFRLEWLQLLCGLWLLVGAVALTFQRIPKGAVNDL